MAKYYVTDRAIEMAAHAFRLLGGKGYVKEHRLDRFLRDFYGLLAGGGAQDILEVDLGARSVSDLDRRQQRGAQQ